MDALQLTLFDRENINIDNGVKYEGYWAQSVEDKTSVFPFPQRTDGPWQGKDQFLAKLHEKQSKAEVLHFKGFSLCRLVEKDGCVGMMSMNGTAEYKIVRANDDVIHWPEGYEHYIQVHNVKPSKEFYNFIMN